MNKHSAIFAYHKIQNSFLYFLAFRAKSNSEYYFLYGIMMYKKMNSTKHLTNM